MLSFSTWTIQEHFLDLLRFFLFLPKKLALLSSRNRGNAHFRLVGLLEDSDSYKTLNEINIDE